MAEEKITVTSPSHNEKSAKTRLYIMFGCAVGLAVIVGSMMGGGSNLKIKQTAPELVNLTPGENKDWRSEMQAQYKRIQKQNEEIVTQNKKSLEIVTEALNETKKFQGNITSLEKKLEQIEKQQQNMKTVVQTKQEQPAADSLEARIKAQQQRNTGNSSGFDQGGLRAVVPPPPGVPYSQVKNFGEQRVESYTEAVGESNQRPQESDAPLIFEAEESNYTQDTESIAVESTYRVNEFAGMLPPGAILPVALLSGLDSGTSEYTRANPQPVLMRIQDHAFLPKGRYETKSCFALGSSYGDLSSERVYITGSRVTCLSPETGMMLTGTLNGFVTDSDSIQGLKGTVIRRNGALLAKSILAGFASGLSSLAAEAGTNQLTTISGAVNQTIDSDRILETGSMEGLKTTMDMLAKQYLDEAKNMFPVISVSGGRVGTLIVTTGSKLEWKSYTGQYEKKTTPSALHKSLF